MMGNEVDSTLGFDTSIALCMCVLSELGCDPAACHDLRVEDRLFVGWASFALALVVALVVILLRLISALFSLWSLDDWFA
jgi:hypothetical protein